MKRRDLLKLFIASPMLPYIPALPQAKTFTQKMVEVAKLVNERNSGEWPHGHCTPGFAVLDNREVLKLRF